MLEYCQKERKQNKANSDWMKDRELALRNTTKSNTKKCVWYKNYNFNLENMVYAENGNKFNRKKLNEKRVRVYDINGYISDFIIRINTGHKKQSEISFIFQNWFQSLNYKMKSQEKDIAYENLL